jgi:putative transposase
VRFRFVAAESAQHSVSLLCRLVGVSRQGFYQWRDRPESRRRRQDQQLKQLIGAAFARSWRTYGVPRMHAELRGQGIHVAKKRVARLMAELGIQGVSRRRAGRSTTVAAQAAKAAPDLLGRRFTATRPDRVWVADITYIPTHEGWLFLAAVVDLCSRRVVGWSMRNDLHADLVVDAVSMAIARRNPPAGVVHHSDRGSQYTSLAFGTTLRDSGLVASMGSRGDAYDNALAESFMSTIKTELIKRRTWKTQDQARLAVFQYIETFYNPLRRHSSLDMHSPNQYEKLLNHDTEAAPAA